MVYNNATPVSKNALGIADFCFFSSVTSFSIQNSLTKGHGLIHVLFACLQKEWKESLAAFFFYIENDKLV